MNIFDQINTIPLETILTGVGVAFKPVGNTLCLLENGNETDGWKWDIINWNVTDFVGKRAFGDRITFVMRYKNISKHDAVIWFRDTFHLIDDKKESSYEDSPQRLFPITQEQNMETTNEVKTDMLAKWNSFSSLNGEQIAYIKSREIDPEKVKKYIKNNSGYVSCAIYDLTGLISIQNRSVKEKKFIIEKGSNSRGCFLSDINKEVKLVYVVEWMFDFLTLAQHGVNVIGLKSAKDGLDVVRAFYARGYKIVLIPDADEAGQYMVKEFSDIKYSLLDLSVYEVKDINELATELKCGDGIIDLIESDRTREPINIDWAFEKLGTIQHVFQNNGWRLGTSSPFPLLDKYTQGIIKGKVYTIGGYSNTGKSQFSYEYAQYFLKQWKKVMYFSVEVDTGLLLAYIAKAYYKQNFQDILSGKLVLNKEYFKNLYLYDGISNLDIIIKTIELEKPDVVFLDFVQNLNCPGASEYEKMTKIAVDVQQMAIRNNMVVFSLSQVNNDSRNKDGASTTLKWSGSLFASTDVIFILFEEEWSLKLSITKNKFWKKNKTFDLKIDFETGNIVLNENYLGWNNSI